MAPLTLLCFIQQEIKWARTPIYVFIKTGMSSFKMLSHSDSQFRNLNFLCQVDDASAYIFFLKGTWALSFATDTAAVLSPHSGGISIKASANMDLMRADMGGAATICSAIVSAAKLNLPINIVGEGTRGVSWRVLESSQMAEWAANIVSSNLKKIRKCVCLFF